MLSPASRQTNLYANLNKYLLTIEMKLEYLCFKLIFSLLMIINNNDSKTWHDSCFYQPVVYQTDEM